MVKSQLFSSCETQISWKACIDIDLVYRFYYDFDYNLFFCIDQLMR